jgi:hypothetical protein
MGKEDSELGKLTRVIQWVGKHPGYVVAGALMIAILSLQPSPKPQDIVQDSPADDVPLFI